MNFLSTMPSIPQIRPMFNIGMMMDIPTGTYFLGKNGESILNGGKPAIMSIAGPKNAGKTILALAIELTVGERIKPYQCSIYDTEVSLLYSRLNQLSGRYERMRNIVHGDENLIPEQVKFIITSSAEILGDVYFKSISDLANMKKKDKNIMLTTPLFDSKGQSIKIRVPTGSMIDSLTEFKTTNVEEKMVSKNNVGDSGNNMMWMKQGIAKKQLITQLPNMCANAGMFVTLTAHVGKEFDMDPMAPKEHRLAFQKKGSEYKGVTEAFEFINNIVYEIFDARALQNKEYKTGVLYPVIDSDRDEECTDLMKLLLKVTRNKSGPTGMPVELIYSQREGLLPHLSMFHYLKESERYGLIGNDRTYALALVPDINLSRTTVRGIIDNNFKVKRALEILSEMLQISLLWPDSKGKNLLVKPEDLYTNMINLGYNWDTLLNTRNYWVFNENENEELPFLSTMDILKANAGLYVPFWLKSDYIKTATGHLKEVLDAIPTEQRK